MASHEDVAELEGKQGEKMITIKLRFWTNKIANEPGKILPRHAWAAGMVQMGRNKSHGIVPKKAEPFHSLLDLGSIVETVLIEHGITLHPGDKMQKYFSSPPASKQLGAKQRQNALPKEDGRSS